MSRRTQIGLLVALLLVLAVVIYRNFRPDVMAGNDGPETIALQPLQVPNPALHLGRLERLRQMKYAGTHRNIFSDTLPPPAPKDGLSRNGGKAAIQPAGPPLPARLEVPLTFYGMAVDPKTQNKVAFFTSGDHVLIASQGQTLLGRFRLLEIGANTVVFEDSSSGQTATLRMTPPVTQ